MILEPGMVLHLYISIIKPPKHKFLILGCIEPKPQFLIINSRINTFVQNTVLRMSHQLQITKSDHDFLNHDSWVDCSTAIGHSLEELKSEISNNHAGVVKGVIVDTLRDAIVQCISNSDLWSSKKANPIVDSLINKTLFEF